MAATLAAVIAATLALTPTQDAFLRWQSVDFLAWMIYNSKECEGAGSCVFGSQLERSSLNGLLPHTHSWGPFIVGGEIMQAVCDNCGKLSTEVDIPHYDQWITLTYTRPRSKNLPVEEFLMKWKDTAARLIFQYATEKMSKEYRLKFRRNSNK